MKKVWQKPELVVLVRGKPEESVLAACKGGTVTGAGIQKDYCKGPLSCGPDCAGIAPS